MMMQCQVGQQRLQAQHIQPAHRSVIEQHYEISQQAHAKRAGRAMLACIVYLIQWMQELVGLLVLIARYLRLFGQKSLKHGHAPLPEGFYACRAAWLMAARRVSVAPRFSTNATAPAACARLLVYAFQ